MDAVEENKVKKLTPPSVKIVSTTGGSGPGVSIQYTSFGSESNVNGTSILERLFRSQNSR